MNRFLAAATAATATLLWSTPASTSGCCSENPQWKLGTTMYSGSGNSAMLVPGNDSRVNLLLLLMDKRPAGQLKIVHVAAEDGATRTSATGTSLFYWGAFTASLFPGSLSSNEGSRCQSNAAGAQALAAALAAESKVAAAERAALIGWRGKLCGDGQPGQLPALSKAAEPFGSYLLGAQAFYGGDFAGAASQFAALRAARNPWLRETSLYMTARTDLNVAQEAAVDEYGSSRPGTENRRPIATAEASLLAYLKAYPKGRYATSARGLLRRAYWLGGDTQKLGIEYRKLFALPPSERGISDADLVQEMDYKLFPDLGAGDVVDPNVLAVLDLMQMRRGESYDGSPSAAPISLAAIDAQKAAFGRDDALYGYVRASHAWFVAKQPKKVLALIPDDARQSPFSYLQFSRQMLRGLALEAVGDRNARGFWLEMMAGATQPYQRQALELAMAMHEERNGGIDRVFARDSSVRNPAVRDILLTYSAGPETLRRVASSNASPRRERDAALFMLLYKQLGRGMYADFLRDMKLVKPGAPSDSYYLSRLNYRDIDYPEATAPPIGIFTGTNLGDYGCPALAETVSALARAPKLVGPRLCVADFLRVNGFDLFAADIPRPKDELGGGTTQFPGKPYSRLEVYKEIIGDAKAPAGDKAYALYRAVYCYAPAGSSDCGGVEVDVAQRRAWFQRLKRDYPQSRWAKALDYYW